MRADLTALLLQNEVVLQLPVCTSILDLLRLSLIYQKVNPERKRKECVLLSIVRSMARGKQSKIVPSWGQISCAVHGTTSQSVPSVISGMVRAASVPCPSETECAAVLAGRAAWCELQPGVWQCRNAELGLLRYLGCDWVGVPAAVEGAVSQRGVAQQAGVGTVSVALVFSCCPLHVNALTCSLKKV